MEKKNTSLANKMKKTYYSNDRKQKPSYGRLDIFVKICFQNNK